MALQGSPMNGWTGLTNLGDFWNGSGSGTTTAVADIMDPGNFFGMSTDTSPQSSFTEQALPNPYQFTPLLDPNAQSNVSAYQQQQQAQSAGLNALKANALNPGSSPWATAAMQKNQAGANNEIDKAQQGIQGAANTANGALAMQGGLSEGAREHNQESAIRSAG